MRVVVVSAGCLPDSTGAYARVVTESACRIAVRGEVTALVPVKRRGAVATVERGVLVHRTLDRGR